MGSRLRSSEAGEVAGSMMAIFVIGLLCVLLHNGWMQWTVSTQVFHVTRVETLGGGGDDNFVYTAEEETLIVEDSWVEWLEGNEHAFRSRDTYGKISAGRCYSFRLRGQRWPFWSFHRNIVGLQEVACPNGE